jgi:isoleucyl-tRNA synthetase
VNRADTELLQVVNKYGADALRLYLVNSPVVRAESLKFEEAGVFGVVKDLFLPWYNAYRFMCQNVVRLTQEGVAFQPARVLETSTPSNVLDRWILAATRQLVNSVCCLFLLFCTLFRFFLLRPFGFFATFVNETFVEMCQNSSNLFKF